MIEMALIGVGVVLWLLMGLGMLLSAFGGGFGRPAPKLPPPPPDKGWDETV